MHYTPIDESAFRSETDLQNWEWGGICVRRTFACRTFRAAGELAAAIAAIADEADHHPDIDIRYPGLVHVTSSTHVTGGVTDQDIALARRIDAIAGSARHP